MFTVCISRTHKGAVDVLNHRLYYVPFQPKVLEEPCFGVSIWMTSRAASAVRGSIHWWELLQKPWVDTHHHLNQQQDLSLQLQRLHQKLKNPVVEIKRKNQVVKINAMQSEYGKAMPIWTHGVYRTAHAVIAQVVRVNVNFLNKAMVEKKRKCFITYSWRKKREEIWKYLHEQRSYWTWRVAKRFWYSCEIRAPEKTHQNKSTHYRWP